MKPKIKICGVTNLIDAKNALALGADYVGLNHIEASPRYMPLEEIRNLLALLNDNERQKIVLLTDNPSIDSINETCTELGIGIIQPYFTHTLTDLRSLKHISYKIFQPIRVASEADLAVIKDYHDLVDMIILDTKVESEFVFSSDIKGFSMELSFDDELDNDDFDDEPLGGTGQTFDWELFNQAKEFAHCQLALAGGITASNIKAAIQKASPFMIDLSSGVESKPGIKSLEKMKELFKAAAL